MLDEPELEALGMRTLLAVGAGLGEPVQGRGDAVEGRRRGGARRAVGKGVVFDTGGISIKPGAGMEEMTMDMGGAAVVAGVMRTLALRKAPANVVGLVGLVENMPDGKAQRPGDVVRSMKGDTIEVINTDAEGRLVLADVLWYAQERFKPRAMVDLATLTGAIIVALGHEMAGVFANDDKLAERLPRRRRGRGRGRLADAARARLRQADQEPHRRHGQRRRPAGGVGDGGAVPAALRAGRGRPGCISTSPGSPMSPRTGLRRGRRWGCGARSADPGPVPGLVRRRSRQGSLDRCIMPGMHNAS